MLSFINKTQKKINFNFLTNLLVVVILSIEILPFIYYGENSFVTIHDNLDITVPFYKLFRDSSLFLKFDTPAPILNGISTIYYPISSFNFQTLLNAVFSQYTAYFLSYTLSIIIGYFSMNTLLNYIYKNEGNKNLYKLIALSFCILPVVSDWYFSVATLPLILYVFLRLFNQKENKFNKKVIMLVIFPVFSNFTAQGIFILGLWFVGLILDFFKNRRISKNLFIGFLLLVVGYILVNLRLFYSMFIVKEVLNRSIFNIPADDLSITFKKYLFEGYYHGSTLQHDIILPGMIIGILYINIRFRKKGYARIINFSSILIILFSFIAALYDAKELNSIIKILLPPLDGFNWGRIVFFNRVLWYLGFCAVLIAIYKTKWMKYLAYVLAIIQIHLVLTAPVAYNDAIKNIYHDRTVQQGEITYNEFYSEKLFSKIKKDLNYNGEAVVAFGYHPAVLTYNGFNTLDGYMNSYPLSYMEKFRELIAPELEIDEKNRTYFDMWGGRLYIYSSEMDYESTREKFSKPVNLNIDMNVFADLKGKYILSRAKINNSEKLGIKLLSIYDDSDSIYTIYVYQK